ncbi:RNA 2',3'-cyclic phosphodiesterase [Methanoregula sp.]|uniref:RNA 2',3'-cyclic phosphodiesterase n=1 Tax=Methanoregula sp. TaxID=2052170 RepID=UPI0035696549
MVRAFVALELSGDIRSRLAAAQDVFRTCSARLTFVDPDLIHITAKFLGDVDEGRIPQIKDALLGIPFAPFAVTAGEVTVNNRNRPHTIWCRLDDAGRGQELLSAIDAVLSPLGIAPETRRFLSHATIARVKSADPSLFPALRTLEGKTYGSCTVTGLKLKKSTLTPRGPVYEDLLEVKW